MTQPLADTNALAQRATVESGSIFFEPYSIYYKKYTPLPSKNRIGNFFSNKKSKQITLVFLHPFVLNSDVWKYQVAEFKDKYNLLLIDLPGFGYSKLNGQPDLIPNQLSQDVASVIEKTTSGPIILLGNSLGGAFALSMVNYHKDRLIGLFLLAPMTLEGTNMGIFKRLGQWLSSSAATRALANVANPILPVKLIVQFVFRFSIESSLNVLEKEGFKDFLGDFYKSRESIHALISTAKNLPRWDFLEVLYPLIKVPTVIIWGQKDKVLPFASGKILEGKISTSKLKIIQNMAHHPQLEDPVKINKFLRKFIQNLT